MSDNAGIEQRHFLERRLTWVAGGVLMLLSVAAGFAARGTWGGLSPVKDWLFAAAGILLVVGVGRAGSITSRRLLGSVSTILLVVAPLTQGYWFSLIPADTGDLNAEEDAWVLVAAAYFGVLLVLAIVSVIAIVRAGVIPSPWRWAPVWVMIWIPMTNAIGLALFSAAPLGTPVASFGATLSLSGAAMGVAFLGTLAIALGIRSAPLTASDEPVR
ncbi:hypothetical protein KZC51_11480 [Microbacterium sp. SSW1-49]|uniref:Uncharacterized protein n=1 Tax=Microbacterium croceum TaxID=2851645 RepID=A0ABT0FFB8_9MICO|nr:hypothetical protein [Microbacterium croceum]MCK2036755.1 hypothetical protein [Microbacterium croceum]